MKVYITDDRKSSDFPNGRDAGKTAVVILAVGFWLFCGLVLLIVGQMKP